MNTLQLSGQPTREPAPHGTGKASAVVTLVAAHPLSTTRRWVRQACETHPRASSEVVGLVTILLGIVLMSSLNSCGVKPLATAAATQQGLASYYSNDFQGRRTSNGEIFDQSKYTAAHRSYPFGTIVLVTNLETSATVKVRINDRGPVKPERVIDLTYAAAKALGITRQGLGKVRLNVLEWGKGKS